jgi:hypothetical protein
MKQKVTVRFGLLFSVLIYAGSLFAQYNDACLWLNLSMEKKINKKISLEAGQEFRFNENYSELGTFFTELGATLKYNKHISFSVYYRYSNKRYLDDMYQFRHRYFVDLSLRKKTKPVTIILRSRYQSFAETSYEEDLPEKYLREKLSLKYDLNKKFEPYCYTEIYFPLNNPQNNRIDNLKFALGIEYSLTKHQSFDVYYLIQKQVNVKKANTDFVTGITYKYSF